MRSRFFCLRGLILVQVFWPLKDYFGPLRLDLRLYEYILSLCESILGLRESFVSLNKSILGFEIRFWAFENYFRRLGVNFSIWEFILSLILGLYDSSLDLLDSNFCHCFGHWESILGSGSLE